MSPGPSHRLRECVGGPWAPWAGLLPSESGALGSKWLAEGRGGAGVWIQVAVVATGR